MSLLDLQLLSPTKTDDNNNTMKSTRLLTPKLEENLVCEKKI